VQTVLLAPARLTFALWRLVIFVVALALETSPAVAIRGFYLLSMKPAAATLG
jgi:hypothetical protein